jgi:hypothetical protein
MLGTKTEKQVAKKFNEAAFKDLAALPIIDFNKISNIEIMEVRF